MYRRKKIKPFNEQKFSAILLCVLSLLIFTLVYLDIEISQFHMIVIALGFFIPFVTYKRYKKKQRTGDLQDYAKKNNYEFYEEPDKKNIDLFLDFLSMKLISTEPPFNFLDPKDNHQPKIITTQRVVQTGNGSSTYHTQVFLFKLKKEIPNFLIKKKNLIEKLFSNANARRLIKHLGDKNQRNYSFNKNKNFPKANYYCFTDNDNLDYLLSNKFIDLLNQGLEKGKKQINIESNQKNIIFYVYNKRHTQEDMNYYINLFNAFNEALSQ